MNVIETLKVTGIRNLSTLTLTFSPKYNVFHGDNGAGKTSFLEAIYLLATGRSFRCQKIETIINNELDALTVFANNQYEESLGISKIRREPWIIKKNNERQRSFVSVSQSMPIQIMSPESYHLLLGGPMMRRKFLNWGLFHVEPSFHKIWKKNQRLLLQRNAMLKKGASYEELSIWDVDFIKTSNTLFSLYQQYVQGLKEIFYQLVTTINIKLSLDFNLFPSWGGDELRKKLQDSFQKDSFLGSTQHGPHRIDLIINSKNSLARDKLSRGQQKLLVNILYMAQGILLQQTIKTPIIYLLDDLSAELDKNNLEFLIDTLETVASQVFITSLNQRSLSLKMNETQMFHVEQGDVI